MITIRIGNFNECLNLFECIPEFESPHKIEEYQNRCQSNYLALIAELNNTMAGFKIGYDRSNNGSFYSWMGGVLPQYRHNNVATTLADYQEKWAIENGYTSIKLKTRNKHKAMISFSLNRGFTITETIENKNNLETRIWMEKILN